MTAIRSFCFPAIVATALIGWLAVATPRAQAAFPDNFDGLITELQDRSLALSNSTDKSEQKLFKTVNKVIATINKSSTLSTDIKTAGKVTKTLAKAFPDDFITSTSITINSVIFTNSLDDIITDVFSNMEDDVQAELDTLQTLIDGLSAGKAKDKAQAALDAAQAAIDQADAATDFSSIAKALGTALKDALKGQAIANKAGGGGGGGGGGTNGVTATIMIGGTNDNWVADSGGGAEWVQSLGTLDIGGGRSPSTFLSVALCTNFNGQTGSYALGNSCGSYAASGTFYLISSGTLVISTFDAGTTSTSGTFNFEATDGVTTIVVTNGAFNLTNLTVTP